MRLLTSAHLPAALHYLRQLFVEKLDFNPATGAIPLHHDSLPPAAERIAQRDGVQVVALVVAESDEPRHKRAGRLYIALVGLLLEVDVLVYTPREVEEWSQVPQAFVTTATRKGLVVYEKSA